MSVQPARMSAGPAGRRCTAQTLRSPQPTFDWCERRANVSVTWPETELRCQTIRCFQWARQVDRCDTVLKSGGQKELKQAVLLLKASSSRLKCKPDQLSLIQKQNHFFWFIQRENRIWTLQSSVTETRLSLNWRKRVQRNVLCSYFLTDGLIKPPPAVVVLMET